MREKRQRPERGEIARDGSLKPIKSKGRGVDLKNDIFGLILYCKEAYFKGKKKEKNIIWIVGSIICYFWQEH